MLAIDFFTSEGNALAFTLGLFLGMLVLLEVGRRIAVARRERDPAAQPAGTGAVEGAVFALLGLLVAFTFSGAAARFDERRHLVIEEANAIGTAYLRLDLLPAEARPKLRADFRAYLDARLAAYEKIPDLEAVALELARAVEIQADIWNQALAAGRDLPQATMLLVPALNAMFDIAATRTAASRIHPPPVIFGMLGFVALACSLLAGVGMGAAPKRSWLHMIGFAAILASSVYVILDLEYPRVGLIRVDKIDQVLIEVRKGMD